MIENEFLEKTENLLKSMNTTYTIGFGGIAINPNWKEKKTRPWYNVHLENPKGRMDIVFWGSILEARLRTISFEDYTRKYNPNYDILSIGEKLTIREHYKHRLDNLGITIYDVIAALQKYELGSFDDFCKDFGYDTDSRSAERIYLACTKEYYDLKKMFSDEEIEKLQMIQ